MKKVKQSGKTTNESLSSQTINHILKAGTVSLKWASNNKIIDDNPANGLMKFSGVRKQRGILSDSEVHKLFAIGDWIGNPGNRLGNLLSIQTGLRLGEVVALKVKDLEIDRIHVRHSWNHIDGLKSPKSGEIR